MNTNKKELNKEKKQFDDEKIVNFQDLVSAIEQDIDKRIKESKIDEDDLTRRAKTKNNIMNRIWHSLTIGLLSSFSVTVTVRWRDKIVFEYQIPRN